METRDEAGETLLDTASRTGVARILVNDGMG